jgi:hypothetical protein
MKLLKVTSLEDKSLEESLYEKALGQTMSSPVKDSRMLLGQKIPCRLYKGSVAESYDFCRLTGTFFAGHDNYTPEL